jgi:ketosteroid isomerase-like protein
VGGAPERHIDASILRFCRGGFSLSPRLEIIKETLGMKRVLLVAGLTLFVLKALITVPSRASTADDQKAVAALDTEYQAAVKKNDAATMDRILADDFILVIGSGKTFTKADLLNEARSGQYIYEHQEDTEQTVRVWRDTAVVTAKLWGKGTQNGKPFDYTLWFSDTYVRTPKGWRYVFGQASSPLPKAR